MKRFIALLLMFFFSATSSCYAFSALYYVKAMKTDNLAPIVKNGYVVNGFNLVKENPYYGISEKGDENVVVIMQQSGDNMFYYYRSEENLKVNKSVLKELKRLGITVEQSFNTSLIEIYDNLACEVTSQTETLKVYNFEEPQTSVFEPPAQNNQQQYNQPQAYRGYVTQLSAGTKLQAYLQNAINTATAQKGDRIVAVLTNGITFNGMEIAPQGSLVYGSLSKARAASYGSRNGRVVINFNQLVTPDNKTYNISTEEIDFAVSNEGKIGESAQKAVGAAVGGAVVGLLFGLLADNHHAWRNAAIGAGVAAGSSVIYSTAERGVDAEIPSFTELEITLTQPLSVSVGN